MTEHVHACIVCGTPRDSMYCRHPIRVEHAVSFSNPMDPLSTLLRVVEHPTEKMTTKRAMTLALEYERYLKA